MGYGGGLLGCDGLIEDNEMESNYAYSGGALASCDGTFRNNRIMGNLAEFQGGALWNCDAAIQNNIISYNYSRYQGSVAYGLGSATFINNTLWKNVVGEIFNVDDYGGYQTIDPGVSLFANCGGSTVVKNCIIWGDWREGYPIFDSLSNPPTYCCISGWTSGGTGNISPEDPGMLFPEGNNIRLGSDSPCKDAGASVSVTEDFEGDGRPYNSVYDIGADEYVGGSIPDAPTGLTAERLPDGEGVKVVLDWDDNSPTPDGYYVYRSGAPDGPYERIATVTASAYEDTGLSSEYAYFYSVTASGSESDNSDFVMGGLPGYAIAGYIDSGQAGGVLNAAQDNFLERTRAQHYANWAGVTSGKELLEQLETWCAGNKSINKLVIFSHGWRHGVVLHSKKGFYDSTVVCGGDLYFGRDLVDLYKRILGGYPEVPVPTIRFSGTIIVQACWTAFPVTLGGYTSCWAKALSEYTRTTTYAAPGRSGPLRMPSTEFGFYFFKETGWFTSQGEAWKKYNNGQVVLNPWISDSLMTEPSADGTNMMKCW